MKRYLQLLLAASVVSYAPAAAAQAELNYDAAITQFRLPDNIHLGEVAGVARNSRGDMYVYTRTGNPHINIGVARAVSHGGSRLLQFNSNGEFIRELGQGSYGFVVAQQVRIDPQDNVWVVDQLSSLVMRFNPEGRITMVIGRKPEAMTVPARPAPAERPAGTGAAGESFNRPTDVAWDAQGNIYVSDGYGNARVAKYDPNGKWIKNFGTRGSGPGEFNDLAGIQIDGQGNLYVADRGNRRIQVFDLEGNFRREFGNVGSPAAICLTSGPQPVLYVSNSNAVNDMENDGQIYRVSLDGTVTGRFGTVGKNVKQFGAVNAIDCRNPTQLLIGELGNWRVQRVTLR
jgi:hypothetical protein